MLVGSGAFIDGDAIGIEIKVIKVAFAIVCEIGTFRPQYSSKYVSWIMHLRRRASMFDFCRV